VQRGEVYFVTLDPVVGREQAGRRPVVVISDAVVLNRPLVISVVPGTDGSNVRRDYPTTARVDPPESGLRLQTVFLAFQVRSLDVSRFSPNPDGLLSDAAMARVDEALRYCLSLSRDPGP
jgi:mRNA interferase MazF